VISTRRKSGTTWMQMICALLIFQTPELPEPLGDLSPWLDNMAMPHDFVYAQLGEQRHRRFIKTHTPLDGIPLDPRVTYLVMARHPLDMFVSLCRHDEIIGPPPDSVGPGPVGPPPHGVGPGPVGVGHPPDGVGPPPDGVGPPPHGVGPPPHGVGHPPHGVGPPPHGIGPPPVGRLTGLPSPPKPPGPPAPPKPPASRETLHDALLRWIANDDDPRRHPDSLPGVMWHLSDAWARRGELNVLLVRYDDLLADLEGQMRWLAGKLGIAVPEQAWPALIQAATFERMRDRADILVPLPPGISVDTALFFRRGTSGAGHEILSDEEMAGYHARAAQLAPPDMLEWLHSASRPSG
jgi:aryl sulfotransferase